MHYHDLDNQLMKSPLERHIYSRGLGLGINIMSKGFRLKMSVLWARLSSQRSCYLFLGISHPNIWRYGTSVGLGFRPNDQ